MKRFLLVLVLLAAPAHAAITTLQWGVDRTTSPWTTCVYDANNVCQGVFTVPATGGGALIPPTTGGTGVNNGASTLTLGGNAAFAGAFTFTGNLTGNTNVTFPTSGTLATTTSPAFSIVLGTTAITGPGQTANYLIFDNGGTPGELVTLPAAVQGNITALGTIVTGVWNGTSVGPTYGGTGVNNGAKTITLGASLATTGAGPTTLAFGAGTNTYTFPNASDTVDLISQPQTLTSKTLASPTFTGTVGGSGTVPNSVLVNSSITIAGHLVSLGGSQTLAASDLSNGVSGSGAVVLASGGTTTNLVVGTQSPGNNSTTAASTAYADAAVAAVLGKAPESEGRLTLSTGTPVMATTVSASGTVYHTPYSGNVEPLWNGTAFVPTACAETSNILANSATGNAGPAAAAASSVYDLFEWSNAGVCTLTRGPAWTNTTTRSAGTALARINGVETNSVAITNGPGANAGTYVGTVYTDSGGATVTWSRGGAASGGTAGVLNVWNMYNRVTTGAFVTDGGSPYTYASATIRQARASVGNQVTFVVGLQEDSVAIALNVEISTAAVNTSAVRVGIGINSTTAFTGQFGVIEAPSAQAFVGTPSANLSFFAPIGATIASSNEGGDANTSTYDNNSTNALSVTIRN